MALRAAGPENIPELSEILAEGFSDDPMFRWMFDGPDQARLLRGWMDLVAGMALAKGPSHIAGDACATLWCAYGVQMVGSAELDLVGAYLRREAGERAETILAGLGGVGAAKPKEPASVHLVHIATRPSERGKGLGSQAVAPVLSECDANGWPVFLNSTNPRNHPFYERLGFRVVDQVQMLGGGPVIYPMWRRPATAS